MFTQLVFRHLNEQNEALFMTLSGFMSANADRNVAVGSHGQYVPTLTAAAA